MVLGVELPVGSPAEHQSEEDQTPCNVGSVKAGHREEGASELIQAAELDVGVGELPGRAALEKAAEEDGGNKKDKKAPPVVMRDRLEREVAGHAAGKQDYRVEEGDRPPVDRHGVRRRPAERVRAEEVEVHGE